MRYLVTGGAGFIGSHLVETLLNSGVKVTIIDNLSTGREQNINHFKGDFDLIVKDLSDNFDFAKITKDHNKIFHLAARADVVPSIETPDLYFNSNVIGTHNLLEALRKSNKIDKLIYSASSSCYGIPKVYPTDENEECNPQYPYALTKYIAEQQILHWGKIYKIPSISLRFFNVYGPRSRTSGTYGAVFGVFLKQKLENKPFTIVGDGEQTRDFTYVSDVVNAIIKAANSDKTNKVYNVGSDKAYSINYLVKLLQGMKEFIPKRPGEPDCTFANISKIKKELNWKPIVSIEDGVKKMLSEIEYWKDAPLWDKDSIKLATENWFKFLK
jgi:UDP-glucose 4-epimerase